MTNKTTKLDIKNIESIAQLEEFNISFEEAYKHLEEIVNLQERGGITLEDSIKYYKIGKVLSEYATSVLEKAKLEIEKVN